MGTSISLDLADPLAPDRAGRAGRRRLRLDARGRRPVQHVQGRQRGEPARRRRPGPHDVRRSCARCWSGVPRCGSRPTATSTPTPPAGSTRPGYVKGWAVQVASDRLLERRSRQPLPQRRRRRAGTGVRRVRRSRGGSACATRGRPTGSVASSPAPIWPWPRPGSTSAATTWSTRSPVSRRAGLRSVTVVGPDLGTADAYATAAVAMGTAGLGLAGRALRLRVGRRHRRRRVPHSADFRCSRPSERIRGSRTLILGDQELCSRTRRGRCCKS